MAKTEESKAQHRRMGEPEDAALYQALQKHGRNFAAIQADPAFALLAPFPESVLINRYSRLVTLKDVRFSGLRERLGASGSGPESALASPCTSGTGSPERKRTKARPEQAAKSSDTAAALETSKVKFNRTGYEPARRGPAPKKLDRSKFPINEVFDVEAYVDGDRQETLAQFNIQLTNSRRYWLPKDSFHREDERALREFVMKLQLKLRVAQDELERILRLDPVRQEPSDGVGPAEETQSRKPQSPAGTRKQAAPESGRGKPQARVVIVDGSEGELDEKEEGAEEPTDGHTPKSAESGAGDAYGDGEGSVAFESNSLELGDSDDEKSSIATVHLDEVPFGLGFPSSDDALVLVDDIVKDAIEAGDDDDEAEEGSPGAADDDFSDLYQTQAVQNASSARKGVPRVVVTASEHTQADALAASPTGPTKRQSDQQTDPSAPTTPPADEKQAKKTRVMESLKEARENADGRTGCPVM